MGFRVFTAVLLFTIGASGPALATGDCAEGRTLVDGRLTIATGNPAYDPWVIGNSPESGEGFEAAVAYAVAERLGFDAAGVDWVRAGFDESIQPGAKNFDFNLQQFSITAEREKTIDFSVPYYSAAMAVLVRRPTLDAGARPTIESLKSLKWGAVATTTALPVVTEVIQPESSLLLYDDSANATEAMKAGQIDAAIFDLPTALFLAKVVLDDGVVLGQFPADRVENPDRFGFLMEQGSPLRECVNAALAALAADGTLAAIEARWLQQVTGVPVIR